MYQKVHNAVKTSTYGTKQTCKLSIYCGTLCANGTAPWHTI